jgi:hypothetical protein
MIIYYCPDGPDGGQGTARPAWFWFLMVLVCGSLSTGAAIFTMPTPNRALLEGNEAQFFAGTADTNWGSGMFGCVRTGGNQMHEGLDIRATKRDRQGEPLDIIYATAKGTVVYVSNKSALSNYGKYVVIRHNLDSLEVYSLYAHLSRIQVRTGQKVESGDAIAVMGRTTNTRSPISKERAHLHFEVGFLVNDRFPQWYQKAAPGQHNDHGLWNGRNLLAIDPRPLLMASAKQGGQFNFLTHVRNQSELCRVFVRDTQLPWVTRYPGLVKRNPAADREGIAGYEIALNFNGVPFALIPRTKMEARNWLAKWTLLSVQEGEAANHHCRKLLRTTGDSWELGSGSEDLLSLLTF